MPFLTCEVAGQTCYYHYLNLKGQELPVDERMAAFARKYATKWVKENGSLPRSQHPFPSPWEPTFLIEFQE